MKTRMAVLTVWAWALLASPTPRAFQAALLRSGGSAAIHTPLLTRVLYSMSAIDLAILVLLAGLVAALARRQRRYERRIDVDASLAETVISVRAWAARERITLHGYEPDAPTMRLRGDAPTAPCGRGHRAAGAAFRAVMARASLLAGVLLVPFALSLQVYRALGLAAGPAIAAAQLDAARTGLISLAALLLLCRRGAARTRYTLQLATLITGPGLCTMLRVRVSRRDPVSLARVDRLLAVLPAGPVSVSRHTSRQGHTCAALTITPPLAGWPPTRPRSRDRALVTAYQEACVAWLSHLQREVAQHDLCSTHRGNLLAGDHVSRAEQRLVAALRAAGLPVESGCAVPSGSTHPDAQYAFYWPDGALRDAAAWLLVDVECDGREHRSQTRRERDRRRDLRLRRRGWYVARVDLELARGNWPLDAARDLMQVVQHHQEAILAAQRAGHGVATQTQATTR